MPCSSIAPSTTTESPGDTPPTTRTTSPAGGPSVTLRDSNRPGDMPINEDLNFVVNQPCANGRRLPVVIEELGTSRELPGVYTASDESGRLDQEIYQLRTFLGYDQVVGIGSWSSESPLTPIWRHDNRRGLRNAVGDYLLDVYTSTSFDGGLTFGNDFRINDAPFDPNPGAPDRFPPLRVLRIGE